MFNQINPFLWLLLTLLDIYFWIIVIAVVASWLVGFGVVNTHNHFARRALLALSAMTEPVLRPVRRLLPNIAGLDLSPMVVCLLIMLFERLILYYGVRYI